MTRPQRLTAGAVSIVALAAALTSAADRHIERGIVDALAAAGATANGVHASIWTGRVTLRDVALGAATIGRVDLHRPGPFAALAQSQDVTVENLSFTLPGVVYAIPRIAVTGSTLSRADLESLLRGPWTADGVARFSRLSASAVVIPTMTIDIVAPNAPQAGKMNVTYRDIRMSGIASGRIGQTIIASATIEGVAEKGEAIRGEAGRAVLGLIDLPEAIRFYTQTGPSDAPLKPIFGGYALDGFRMTIGDKANFRVGRISAGAFNARPPRTSLVSLLEIVQKAPPGGKLPDAEALKVVGMVGDLFDAIESDQLGEANEISILAQDGANRAEISIRSIRNGSLKAGRFAEIALEGLEVRAAGGVVKLARYALEGLDLRNTFQRLPALAANPSAAGAADWRKLVPKLDAFVIKGVDIDVPNPEAGRRGAAPDAPQRIAGTIDGFELRLGAWRDAIPTAFRIALDRFAAKVPELRNNEGAQQLRALGYDAIDVSFAVDGAWNEAAKTFAFKEFGVKGAKMGEVGLTAELGDIPPEAFSGDPAQMQVALLSASARSASVRVRNDGLIDRLIEQAARQANTSPSQLRAQYGSAAAVGIPSVLGPSDASKALAAAVAAFIAKPSNLTIEARAKSPAGLGAADFLAMSSPADIVDKLDISARANQ